MSAKAINQFSGTKGIFKLQDSDMKKLEDVMLKLPGKAETIINNYLHTKGVKLYITEVKKRMPVGEKDNKKSRKGYPRDHAKFAESLISETFNLGFVVKTSHNPFFGYLYFPSFAEGTSKRNVPNPFFDKGEEIAREKIVNNLLKELNEEIEKEA